MPPGTVNEPIGERVARLETSIDALAKAMTDQAAHVGKLYEAIHAQGERFHEIVSEMRTENALLKNALEHPDPAHCTKAGAIAAMNRTLEQIAAGLSSVTQDILAHVDTIEGRVAAIEATCRAEEVKRTVWQNIGTFLKDWWAVLTAAAYALYKVITHTQAQP